jgi:hypothetical protein
LGSSFKNCPEVGFKFQNLPRTGGLLIHRNLKCNPDGVVHRGRQDVKPKGPCSASRPAGCKEIMVRAVHRGRY